MNIATFAEALLPRGRPRVQVCSSCSQGSAGCSIEQFLRELNTLSELLNGAAHSELDEEGDGEEGGWQGGSGRRWVARGDAEEGGWSMG